jgi:hypothetical protein
MEQSQAKEAIYGFLKKRGAFSESPEAKEVTDFKKDFVNKIGKDELTKEDFSNAMKIGLVDSSGNASKSLKLSFAKTSTQEAFSLLQADEALQSWNLMRAYEKPLYAEIFARKISDATAESLGITEDEQDKLIDSAYAIADKAPEKPDMLSKFEDLRDKVMEGVGK